MLLFLFYIASVIYTHLQCIDLACTMLTITKESTRPIVLHKQYGIYWICVRNILFLGEEIYILMGYSIFFCPTDLEPGPVISFGPWTVSWRDSRRSLKPGLYSRTPVLCHRQIRLRELLVQEEYDDTWNRGRPSSKPEAKPSWPTAWNRVLLAATHLWDQKKKKQIVRSTEF